MVDKYPLPSTKSIDHQQIKPDDQQLLANLLFIIVKKQN